MKNDRIAQRAEANYKTGRRRKVRDSWKDVPRVSVEEQLLAPWFAKNGWSAQFGVTLGIGDVHLPRFFRLDFAELNLKLNVEIDGSVHRLRRERDARRDVLLQERGWRTLRVPASAVRGDAHAAIELIAAWITDHETIELKK